LVLISGLSGGGKSTALRAMEDLGCYCVDNLPAALLKEFATQIVDNPTLYSSVALGIDARSRSPELGKIPEWLDQLTGAGLHCQMLFLTADVRAIIKRFSETRRRHPLAEPGTELRQAIELERKLLGPVINAADLIIDTTHTSVYELAEAIRDRVDRRKSNTLSVLIESFGFKHGIPADADFVFDLRCLPNPYWQTSLRSKTGLDPEVTKFLDQQPSFNQMYEDILGFLSRWIPQYVGFDRNYLTVAIGCTGGQHRSVYMAEKLTASLKKIHDPVLTRHKELP